MSYLIIKGGKKLRGSVPTQSNKNSALSILAACLLVKGRCILRSVPDIADVRQMITLLRSLGVKVARRASGEVVIDSSGPLRMSRLNERAATSTRASLLLLGALSSRVKQYLLPKSGGCHLGGRTVRPHLLALKQFGVRAVSEPGYYRVINRPLKAVAQLVMYESGDTATENAILAAVLAPGTTTIKFASANYMVQDLCYFLQAAGARLNGIGTTTLNIQGVPELLPVTNYPIMPDPIVSFTLLSAAITTHSALTVTDCPVEFLELELTKLAVMGQKFKQHNLRFSENGQFRLADIEVVPSKLVALPDKIYGRPFPGLNIDNLPLFIPILATARGRTLVHDWVYEDRVMYSLELKKLGAQIALIDTHRVWVEGPARFTPNEVICPPALRPAVNVLLCMLAAPGRSVLRGSAVIERGYEYLPALLNRAGADITTVAT